MAGLASSIMATGCTFVPPDSFLLNPLAQLDPQLGFDNVVILFRDEKPSHANDSQSSLAPLPDSLC